MIDSLQAIRCGIFANALNEGETLIDFLVETFSLGFMVRTVVVGLLVSLCAALLGVSLVLKRYSMIGDGLSNVGFGTLAIATATNAAPLAVSLPIVVLAAFLLLRISENSKIKGDAAIALISTTSLAIGVIIISLTTGMNLDVCNYMFGSILVMTHGDVVLSVTLTTVVLVLFVLFYNKIFAVTFDENFAKATGTKAGIYNMLIAFLTAITIVLGMRMMGALLISSLIIFPALTSMRICKRFISVTVSSAIVSVICFSIGVVISCLYFTPTGASVVIVNVIAFLLFWAVNFFRNNRFFSKGSGKKMKKTFVLFVFCILFLSGCGNDSASPRETSPADSVNAADEAEYTDSKFSDFPEITSENTNHAETFVRPDGDVVEIKERLFVAQTNDIYFNPKYYIGKTIKYEGIFSITDDPETGEPFNSVIRFGPGCCGEDENPGFEVAWDDEYPNPNDWVEVVGILEEYEVDGYKFLRLALSSMNVMTTRGEPFVRQ